MIDVLIKLGILAFLGYVIWSVVRPKHPIKIVMDRNGVRQHKGLPQAHARKVVQYLEDHAVPKGKLVIYIAREPNGHLRTEFRGSIDAGLRQRVRNFLVDTL